ncbi:hypothetical protein BDV28DRAFT_146435 [Aspergillus coremiiformis]|uniref:Nucleosome assembly protein n=1 Tax=Aspergillus coremiiformis TaxID=138285 RepID=A0A5N6ZBV5_9EURO|nr:hypothetical protein BDV28DRAFT_146435 [Aspergillus coremiiformis]
MDPPSTTLKDLSKKETSLTKTWSHTLHTALKHHHEENKHFYKHRAEQATGWTNDTRTHTPPIPDFWLLSLRRERTTRKLVTKPDLGPLKALIDVRVEWLQGFDYVLVFCFAPNEFFTNRVIRKAFYYENPEGGPCEPMETRGDRIYWRKNHILQAECHARIGARSFFAFVSRSLETGEEGGIEGDFEFGRAIRDRLVPNALGYHLGAFEGEGSGEEEEEEEEDEDEDGDYDMEW